MAEKKRSGGPKTEAGKARSSQNARKHGLLTEKIFILQTEDPAEWQKLQDAWIAKLEPKDDIELVAVNRIAFAVWRMHRLWALETAAIDFEMDKQGQSFNARYGEDGDPFLRGLLAFDAFAAKESGAGLMHRYQSHLERCYTRAFKAFMDLRTKTKLLNELEAASEETREGEVPAPQQIDAPPPARIAQQVERLKTAEETEQERPVNPPATAGFANLPNELPAAAEQPKSNVYTDIDGPNATRETPPRHGSAPVSPHVSGDPSIER